MIDIEKVKNALPLPLLLERLGHKPSGKGKYKCPFHDDKTPSLSIRVVGQKWKWKCHAGCGGGDEIDYVAKEFGLTNRDAIRRYAEIAGVDGSWPLPITVVEALKIFGGRVSAPNGQKPLKAKPLNEAAKQQLVEWRGYSPEFVDKIAELGLVRLYDGHIAFPVKNGFHFRLKDGTWRYSPPAASPDLFVLGEIEEGANIHCFESQWDALAYAEASGELNNVIATRGAGNAKLAAQRFAGHSGTLYLWPQNDEAGQKWAEDIREALPSEQIKLARVPVLLLPEDSEKNRPVKDLNEWRKAGATDGDVWQAFIDAKDFPVPVLAEPGDCKNVPQRYGKTETTDEARESNENIHDVTAGSQHPSDSRGGENISDNNKKENENDNQKTTGETVDRGSEARGEGSCGRSAELLPRLSQQSIRIPKDTKGPRYTRQIRGIPEEDSGDLQLSQSGAQVVSGVRRVSQSISQILDQIVEYLNRYVSFDQPEEATACSLWVAHTWIYRTFRWTPYLHVISPEKRCGKSTLLNCLKLLSHKGWKVIAPTPSSIFSKIEAHRPTCFLDECDAIFRGEVKSETNEILRAILNAGFETGNLIPRNYNDARGFKEFDPFGPKCLAGIGELPDTIQDRSIRIELVRQDVDTEFDDEESEHEAAPIREALESWSGPAAAQLKGSKPERPSQLNSRQKNMAKPLLAIAELAGAEWKKRAQEAIVTLAATSHDSSLGVQLLRSCQQIFFQKSKDKIFTSELQEALIGQPSADWATMWENDLKRGNINGPARKMSKLLERYRIKSSNIRIGDVVARGYYRDDFMDAWKRYLEPVKSAVTGELGI